jgi:ATP-binding cassette subfamily B protein
MQSRKLPMKATVKYFWRHVVRHKWWAIGILVVVPLASLTLFYLPPLIVANLLQRVTAGDYIQGDLWGSFGVSIVGYIALSALGGIALWRLAVYLIWSLHQRVIEGIHREIFAHLMSMSANFHANRFGGSLVSQANKLAGAYVSVANTTLFELSGLIFAFIFSSIILWPRVPGITIALLVFSVVFMVLATRVTRPVRHLRAIQSEFESKQTGLLADATSNVLAIKSFAAEKFENKRYGRATRDTRNADYKVMMAATKRDTIFSTSTVTIGSISLVLTVASIVIYHANIGTAFLVLTYTGTITQRLWDFAQSMLREYNRAFGDAKDMIEILAIEPDVKDPESPEPSKISDGAIQFQNVDFTHPDSGRGETLFVGLDLGIAAGQKIGLVGHSGSGKTTLTKLLLRFNDIDNGQILIDGQNIAHITQADLRKSIAYVPQEPLLFHRTIRENIAYSRPDATLAEVQAAAEKAYAHDFIEKLPKGYDTLVGERGVKLSGGQRQRVAIARAILKDAPILVLDEATSALDSESEKLIQAALWELMKNRTAIVIAHRLSTIQRMDRIVVLDNGKIIEEGNHRELLEKKGVYAKLWSHQSGGFIEE